MSPDLLMRSFFRNSLIAPSSLNVQKRRLFFSMRLKILWFCLMNLAEEQALLMIAYAVFRHLVEKVNCRLLFATHYHPLTKEFASHPQVTLQHMSCAFRTSPALSITNQELVFLYRLAPGACPESYGLQVALMAGIPSHVVQAATKAGLALEKSIGQNFQLSGRRSQFSSIHEEWLKALVAASMSEPNQQSSSSGDDAFDALFCLRCELKRSYSHGNQI